MKLNWTRRRVLGSLALSTAGIVASCQRQPNPAASPSPPAQKIPGIRLNGAGATFPGLLYSRWFAEYRTLHPEIEIDYQPVGSGTGVKQFIDNTVDFAASDIAMTDAEVSQVKRGVVFVPATAGSVVLTYNLPGIPSGLKLSRRVYTDIFLGKIKEWQDPAIQALNPTLKLPKLPIFVAFRADGSGTTSTFTRHLSAISSTWKRKVGTGLSVNWPTGVGVKGNEGLSAQVQVSEGVIGYLEYAYAKDLNLAIAALENQKGNYIAPTQTAAQSTLDELVLSPDLRGFLPDPTGSGAYPIVTYTWILLYQKYPDAAKAKALKDLLLWALADGQKFSAELGYLPLSQSVAQKAQAAVQGVS